VALHVGQRAGGVQRRADYKPSNLRARWGLAHRSQGFGDIFDLGQSQQTDGEVAQAGHHLGAFPFSDLCTVLVESHISYIVRTIFNRPLPSNVRKHLFRISLLDGEAGQTERGFGLDLSSFQADKFPTDPKHLSTMRKVNLTVQDGGDLNPLLPVLFHI